MEFDNRVRKIILLVLFMLMIGISVFVFNGQKHYANSLPGNEGSKVTLDDERYSAGNPSQKQDATIKIYVTGEVKKPGVYNVAVNSRGLDAINLAGGFTERADVQKVNVTRLLRDGTQLNVPALKKNIVGKKVDLGEKKGRAYSFKRSALTQKSYGYDLPKGIFVEKVASPANVLVSLNKGTFNELNSLPGIHPELSRRIIKYRSEHGFSRIYDLMKVEGISPQKFVKLQPYITL